MMDDGGGTNREGQIAGIGHTSLSPETKTPPSLATLVAELDSSAAAVPQEQTQQSIMVYIAARAHGSATGSATKVTATQDIIQSV